MNNQLTVQDSVLSAKWDSFLEDYMVDTMRSVDEEWPDRKSLQVSFLELQNRDPELADYMLSKPRHCLQVGTHSVRQVMSNRWPRATGTEPSLVPKPVLRVTQLPPSMHVSPRRLGADSLGRLVCVQGIVTASSDKLFRVIEAAFDCKTCGNRIRLVQDGVDDPREEPVVCDACEKPGPWTYQAELSTHLDMQVLRLQEHPEGILGGQTPEVLTVRLYGDLAHSVVPGARVVITGIMSLKYRRQNGKLTNQAEPVLEAIDVSEDSSQVVDLASPPGEKEAFAELAKRPDVHDVLAKCLVPSVQGLEDVKLAILYALAGAPKIQNPDGSSTRGRIHVLVAGDPGVAKSRILGRIKDYVPRCIEVSGLDANRVGLGAGLVKDETTGDWMIEPGALVLGHGAVVCLDELGLVDVEDRPALNDAAEMGFVRLTKVKKSTLPAETVLLMAMNPVTHRFDTYTPLIAQLGLQEALRSRIDLIFCVRDIVNKQKDRQLARQQLHALPAGVSAKELYGLALSSEELRRYLHQAQQLNPVMQLAAAAVLEDYYEHVRQSNVEHPPFTPRQLDGLRRLACASARLRLSDQVEVEDAHRAIRIMALSLKSCGIMDDVGRVDGSLMQFGQLRAQTDRLKIVLQLVKDLQRCHEAGYQRGWARHDDVVEKAGQLDPPVLVADVEWALKELVRTTVIYARQGRGTYAVTAG